MTTENQDAIQQDVSSPAEETTPIERPKTARELAMEQIEQAQLARLKEETGVDFTAEPAPAPEPVVEPEPEPEPTLAADSQVEAQMQETVIDKVDGLKVRVKIDGEESEVPLADILRNYQKGSAADKRLEEATRLLREAEARAAASPAPAPSNQADTSKAAAPVGDELVEHAKKALATLYEGDEEGAAKLLAETIMKAKDGNPPTPQPVVPSADELASAVEQRLAVKSAFATIQKDYPDVLSDPDLDKLCALKTQAKEADGKPRHEAMLEAAQDVYKLIGKKPAGRQATDQQQTTRDEKLARKANLDELKTANASATTTQVTEDTSPSALIASMAARRLGQSLPRAN